MKSKRYTTEQKIRILRAAERAGKSIVDVCREKGISEQTFHRWKRQFGMMPLERRKTRIKPIKPSNYKGYRGFNIFIRVKLSKAK